MKVIKSDEWKPSLKLEDNAITVAKSSDHHLVVAGPGAGKTELLAQKASFLLETNTCRFPGRILAISFKKDAAFNLKERVKLRCGDELARRFDSFTFDSFAKQLLDRFRSALPAEYKIGAGYRLLLDERTMLDYYRAVDETYYNTTQPELIKERHTGEPLPFIALTREDEIGDAVWSKMLNGKQPLVTFKMIMRLAELIINTNPIITDYLQQTYSHVFLDEFQDTTGIQYDFFKACFLGSTSRFTAVGDDKQRIMTWAGAVKTVFEDFVGDTRATRVPLQMNFRSAPRLVTLINHLTTNLLGKADLSIPSDKWQPHEGECFVWVFENPDAEMQALATHVQQWLTDEQLEPRDICILVKQQTQQYAGALIEYFNANGLKARDETKLQDILSDDLCLYIIHTILFMWERKAFESKNIANAFMRNLYTEAEDQQVLKLEASFSNKVIKLGSKYKTAILTKDQIGELVDETIGMATMGRIKAVFPVYKDDVLLSGLIEQLKENITDHYLKTMNMDEALNTLLGKNTIPVMTVHKSKGLEYHTIIFIGLEDGAFWSFNSQPDEDKCTFFVALSRAKKRVVFTFSKVREGKYGTKKQSIQKIQVFFEELENSGVVVMEEKT